MPASLADLHLPTTLLAGGGPSTPEQRVLRALTTPVIGQFDPAFTAIMDDVMALGRSAFLTSNERCFAVSGFAPVGLEAILNSFLAAGDGMAVEGSPGFVARVERIARGYGLSISSAPKLAVVPHVDPQTGEVSNLQERTAFWHAQNVCVVVEATHSLGGLELRTDEWGLDAVVAGVDHCLGAPSGMTLVTYSKALEATLQETPKTSFLDLRQLQAYWGPERLNHHTAPTSLIYGLREALRLVVEEGLDARWERHAAVASVLREGLRSLGFDVHGDGLVLFVPPRPGLRQALRQDFAISVDDVDGRWRVGLLGADAQRSNALRLLAALAAARL